jgi:hypothetical protein
MNLRRLRSAPSLVGIAVAAASLALYLSTLAPTLTWGWRDTGVDGGEFLAAANTFGVPHPPGYPTYTLLLRLFATAVPLGDFAYRGNLLSAVLASGSVLAVYWVITSFCRYLRPEDPRILATIGAALGSAMLAVSPLFWSQAIITEVYALNALFAGALLLIASRLALSPPGNKGAAAERAGGDRATTSKLALFGFLFGIGLGNHFTLLVIAVPLLYWLWWTLGWRRLISVWVIGAFAAGIAIYVYLPISAAQDPPVNWGNADTVSGFVWMLTAQPYQQYVFGLATSSIPDRLLSWAELVFAQFNPLGLFVGLMSVPLLLSRAPRFFLPSVAGIALLSIYTIMYNTFDFEVLMVPAFLLFSILAGVGFFWVLSLLLRASSARGVPQDGPLRALASRQVLVLSLLAFALLPGITVALNYGSLNLRGDYSARVHADGVLNAAPDGSVLVSNHERNVFSQWYMRFVEKPERDVAVIAAPLLQFDWYLRDAHRMFPERVPDMPVTDIVDSLRRIVQHNEGRSKVLFTFKSVLLDDKFDLTEAGVLYEVTLKQAP